MATMRNKEKRQKDRFKMVLVSFGGKEQQAATTKYKEKTETRSNSSGGHIPAHYISYKEIPLVGFFFSSFPLIRLYILRFFFY